MCILHICVLWDQQVYHACLLPFAGAGGIVKILFLVQWHLTFIVIVKVTLSLVWPPAASTLQVTINSKCSGSYCNAYAKIRSHHPCVGRASLVTDSVSHNI